MSSIISHELAPWLILHLAPKFGPANWRHCWQHFPSPRAFCEQKPNQLLALRCAEETVSAIRHPNWHVIEQAIIWSEQANQAILTCQHPSYPKLLRQIAAMPPLLYVRGKLDCLHKPQIAIVGARRPTFNATRLAEYFSEQLGTAGFVISSGLALGIDTAAHRGVLPNGATIAVLGSGLEVIYPEKNREMASKITENGAIVSEFPLFSPPKAKNFPRRNRIISGLSLGVLVVEAALKSGSLITARYALEQNREVFAVPSSVFNPMSAGCHHLIQQGAHLVTSVDDVLAQMPLSCMAKIAEKSNISAQIVRQGLPPLDKDHRKLLECIGFDVTSFEQLVNVTGFSTQKVMALLCELKLNGYIKEELGSFMRVVNN